MLLPPFHDLGLLDEAVVEGLRRQPVKRLAAELMQACQIPKDRQQDLARSLEVAVSVMPMPRFDAIETLRARYLQQS